MVSSESSKDENQDESTKPAFDVPPSPIGDEPVKKKKKKRQKKLRGKAAKQKRAGRRSSRRKSNSDTNSEHEERSEPEVWVDQDTDDSKEKTPTALEIVAETTEDDLTEQNDDESSESVQTWLEPNGEEPEEADTDTSGDDSDKAEEEDEVEPVSANSEDAKALPDSEIAEDEPNKDVEEAESVEDEPDEVTKVESGEDTDVNEQESDENSEDADTDLKSEETESNNEDDKQDSDEDSEDDEQEPDEDSEDTEADEDEQGTDTDLKSEETEPNNEDDKQDSDEDSEDTEDDEQESDEDEEVFDEEDTEDDEDDLPPTVEQPVPVDDDGGLISKLPIAIRSHLTNANNDKELRTYAGGVQLAESPSKRLFAIVAGLVALYATAAGAYNLDQALSNSGAPRGSTLSGYTIENLSSEQVRQATQEIALNISSSVVEVSADDTATEILVSDLGLELDTDAVVELAMESRNSQFVAARPISWLGNVLGRKSETPLIFQADPDVVEEVTRNRVTEKLLAVKEPSFEFKNGSFEAVDGSVGVGLFDSEFAQLYVNAINDGEPYQVSLKTKVTKPEVTLEQAQALASELEPIVEEPLLVHVLDQSIVLDGSEMTGWFAVALDEDSVPVWVVDSSAANETISAKIDKLGLPSVDGKTPPPEFTIVDNQPILLPPAADIECCSTESGDDLKIALLSKPSAAKPLPSPTFDTMQDQCKRDGRVLVNSADSDLEVRRARIEPRFTTSNRDYSQLADLEIVEEVASCTTSHAAGQGRVINIQAFADLMRGTVIEPGETLSLNEHVGRRTTEKGFVPAGAIVDGVIRNDNVGGGISQFITTFFNASFFSGVELVEYQSHSIYISRYPKGLEATISWGGPEQIIKNDTDYGILVWTEYTPTSITVTFYSTKHRDVEAMSPVQYRSGAGCYVVEVGRVIDGEEDSSPVEALYRDREGYNCNGNPTRAQQELDAANNPAAPEITAPVTVPGAPQVPPVTAPAAPVPNTPPTTTILPVEPQPPIIEIPIG